VLDQLIEDGRLAVEVVTGAGSMTPSSSSTGARSTLDLRQAYS
jgi:hypothetical protein